MNNELQTTLAQLLTEAGEAHHQAFAATDGKDPDWPLWYANYLQEPLAEKLDLHFSVSQLVYCLMNADYEHQALAADSNWPEYYAAEMLTRYAPPDSPEKDKLVLYHYAGCPFCSMVWHAIKTTRH